MVTNTLLKGALLHCKRASFTPQKGTFYHVKGHLLQCKRPSIKKQLGITLQQGGIIRSPFYLFFYSTRLYNGRAILPFQLSSNQ